MRHLEACELRCVYAGDIADGKDALAIDRYGDADAIITNPPHTRLLMQVLGRAGAETQRRFLLS